MSTQLPTLANGIYDVFVQLEKRLDAPVRVPSRPYRSPLESELADQLRKHLADTVEFSNGVEVENGFTHFELDLLARTRFRRIAFECDGKAFHTDAFRDRCRDAIILRLNGADTIYRFRGQDLHYNFHDCLYVVAQRDPVIFSERGSRNIEIRASDAVKAVLAPEDADANPGRCFGYVVGDTVTVINRDEERHTEFSTVIQRRTRHTIADPTVDRFVTFALAQPKGRTFQSIYDEFVRR
jgi:very-short-patch-repair endonuclease